MPGFDRTGPMGAGPMTGGNRGRCNPATTGTIPAYTGGYGYDRGLGLRRGFKGGCYPGRGGGRGNGRGGGGYPFAGAPAFPVDAAAEIDMLKAQVDQMKNSLDAIYTRIGEIGGKPAEEL